VATSLSVARAFSHSFIESGVLVMFTKSARRASNRCRSRHLRYESLEVRQLLATFAVVNTADAGAGSLRQAILDANANPGADDIRFDIDSGPQMIMPFSALPAVTSELRIDGTTQPGFAGSPLIEIRGFFAGPGVNGLTISGNDAEVRGLAINSFSSAGVSVTGNDNIIAGNWIGLTGTDGNFAAGNGTGVVVTGARNVVGGMSLADRNVISASIGRGVSISGAAAVENVVSGNYIGLNAAGTFVLGNRSDGIRVQNGTSASNQVSGRNLLGGTAPGAGNVIAGSLGEGITIVFSRDCTVQGNYVGADPTGTLAFSNNIGIFLNQSSNNLIGGTDAGAGNLVSGNRNNGISVLGSGAAQIAASGNVVQGNYVGTQAGGTGSLGNALFGINFSTLANNNTAGGTSPEAGNFVCNNRAGGVNLIGRGNTVQGNSIGIDAGGNAGGNFSRGIDISGSNNLIGGSETGAANRIANTITTSVPGVGIRVQANGSGNRISQNSIFSNSSIGIDLIPFTGPNPNDPQDDDIGGNRLQNYPVIDSVVTGGGNTTIQGTLHSTPFGTFTLEFFSNLAGDPSGFGEGETFIGDATVTTDAAGDASFSVTVAAVPAGHRITATATDSLGNTSEFSQFPNKAPIAHDDSFTLRQDGTLVAFDAQGSATADPNDNGVLANDNEPDGDSMTAFIVSGTSHGSLSFNADGTFVYTPGTGFFGTDSFVYQILDPYGAVSNFGTVTITVDPAPPGSVYLISDACHPGQTAVVVNGTAADDKIQITPSGNGVAITINNVSRGTFNPTGRIIVFGYDGNDDIQVAGAVSREAWLYGDRGNDRLNLGNGGGIGFGGDGDDLLLGGTGRDILIGGVGSDRIIGNSGDDLIIAASSIYDDRFLTLEHEAAWCAIHHEWTRADHTYEQRVANIRDGSGTFDPQNYPYFLNWFSVVDDDNEDTLTGAAAYDWFFANLDGPGALDKITDLKSGEFAEELLL
jgi:Ca2+-binding RTX toxin-like protein